MGFITKYLIATYLLTIMGLDSSSRINDVWIIKSSSSLAVDGSTNINNFSCKIHSYNQTDTLYFSPKEKTLQQIKVNGRLKINVSDFDCKHKVMTRDLQKTLQAQKHPYMIVKFLNFADMPSAPQSNSMTTGDVEIELAGVKRSFQVKYAIHKTNQQNIELIGTRSVNFSDFNLKPPSKLGGTIRVKNELQVAFKLQLKKNN